MARRERRRQRRHPAYMVPELLATDIHQVRSWDIRLTLNRLANISIAHKPASLPGVWDTLCSGVSVCPKWQVTWNWLIILQVNWQGGRCISEGRAELWNHE